MVQEVNGGGDARSEPGKRAQPVKRRAVRVVRITGPTALVEYDQGGRVHRVYVPVSEVKKGKIAENVLEQGVKVGVDWERFLNIESPNETAANALRRMGIWTLDDLMKRIAHAKLALIEAASVNWAEVIEAVKREDTNE